MEGRAEEVVLVATGRRERRRPPACRRHTAKSNNGGVLQRRRRRRLVETCQMRLLQGVRRGGVGHSGRRAEQWRSQEFVAGYAKQKFFLKQIHITAITNP